MSKVTGRTDDMLIVRGVNVFPSQIEEALLTLDELAPQYLILVDRRVDHLDDLEIWVEPTAEVQSQGGYALGRLQEKAHERVVQALGINVRVRVVAPREIERSQGKAVRVIDRRPE